MAIYVIQGQIVQTETQQPITGARLEAWDKDLIYDDLVGATVTNEFGEFEFIFKESYFQDLFENDRPDLYFKVFKGKDLIKSTKDDVLWNLSQKIAEVKIEVENWGEDTTEPDEFSEFPEPLAPEFPDEFSGVDFDRIKKLALTGSQPYSDRELVERRQVIQKQINAVFAEAKLAGLSQDMVFQVRESTSTENTVNFADNGSLGPEGEAKQGGSASGNGGNAPCCTPRQIAAELVRIKAAYTAAVARVNKWKGCQDWSVIVQQAIAPVLGPCWVGKFVWRIKVWPFGRWTPFDDGDTFIHHAYAICPCTCDSFGGCAECIVLDPYTLTGFAAFQTAEVVSFSDWISEGNVWRATTNADHDNCSIYKYTMQYYCRRSQTGGLVQRGTCNAVRKLLMREVARYTGATGEVLQRLYRSCGLIPNCC